MLLSCIEDKDVVNVVDGKKIGFVCDLEIEVNSGKIFFIYVQTISRLLNIFSKDEKIKIPWDQIIKIGEDVIIVNYPCCT